MADHVQRVIRPNFAASWDEIGDENQVEETFALSTMKDIPGTEQHYVTEGKSVLYTIIYSGGGGGGALY